MSTPPRTWRHKQIEIQTPTPGFAAQIYVANHIDLSLPYGDSTPLTARGWRGPVGEDASVRDGAHIPAHARRRSAIATTSSGSPSCLPVKQSASIAELTLFR